MTNKKNESIDREQRKVKVKIICMRCDEKYVFKGTDTGSYIDTGFQKCICGNESKFTIRTL